VCVHGSRNKTGVRAAPVARNEDFIGPVGSGTKAVGARQGDTLPRSVKLSRINASTCRRKEWPRAHDDRVRNTNPHGSAVHLEARHKVRSPSLRGNPPERGGCLSYVMTGARDTPNHECASPTSRRHASRRKEMDVWPVIWSLFLSRLDDSSPPSLTGCEVSGHETGTPLVYRSRDVGCLRYADGRDRARGHPSVNFCR
jgi:hypothetical protein